MASFHSIAGRAIQLLAERRGYRLLADFPADMGESFQVHYEACRPYTMTSVERLFALANAVEFVVAAEVPGDLVECGVWKGGSALMMARMLTMHGPESDNRRLWLYDTFAGMAEPTSEDGSKAREKWKASARPSHNEWCYSPLDEVKATMALSSFSTHRVTYVVGNVEETIPRQVPNEISLLRLDTDWYSSTHHELHHLWHRLSPGGVLIIDDFGHWEGARRAVEEFFDDPILMHRIDYTGRLIQKPLDDTGRP